MENEQTRIQEFFAAFPPMFRAYRSQVIALLLAAAILISCAAGCLLVLPRRADSPDKVTDVDESPMTLDEKFVANIYDELGIKICDSGDFKSGSSYVYTTCFAEGYFVNAAFVNTENCSYPVFLCNAYGDPKSDSLQSLVETTLRAAGNAYGSSTADPDAALLTYAWELAPDSKYDFFADDGSLLYIFKPDEETVYSTLAITPTEEKG